MNRKNLIRVPVQVSQLAILLAFALAAPLVSAQPVGRFVGTITAISGDTLTVKTDAGEVRQVEVSSAAILKRVEPGQKDLSAAATIQFGDLATGDRVLVRLDPNATGAIAQAAQIIALKQADVAQKQQQEREEWQKNGVGGLVKSVDAANGVILLTTGAGPTLKTITIHISPATVLKRYAPASVRFDLAQPAPISEIHAGDQLRARGTKNADSTELDAAAVVSGSFRNIAGTITSLDPSAATIVVKDLSTKKQVAIHITPDAQMRALPDMMARMIAARLKETMPAAGAAAGTQQHAWSGQGGGNGQWAGRAQGGGDMQQVLNRAPTIQFADLKKGQAVMLVSTAGTTDVTAITLLTGVEPLLEAPEASQNLLANWSMGSGGAADAAVQ